MTLPETGAGKLIDRVNDVSSDPNTLERENENSKPEEEQIKK